MPPDNQHSSLLTLFKSCIPVISFSRIYIGEHPFIGIFHTKAEIYS